MEYQQTPASAQGIYPAAPLRSPSPMSPHYTPTSPTHGMSHVSSSGSSMSPEVERDFYKEKVEHFKVLIRKLQDEIQSYKVRKEGAETVSKLLQEAKIELVSLQKKVKTYESIIRNLQSRLEKNGLSSEIALQEGEQYLPGHSKSLLDNLTRENTRLRNIIRNNSGDPEEFEKQQQHIQQLSQSNSSLQTRVAELEQVLRSSDSEKDKAITQLQENLLHVQRELSTKNSQCSTLAAETQSLQKQLSDVALQCQELARKLHEQGGSMAGVDLASSQGKHDHLDGNKNLQDENQRLKVKLADVTEMNRRWQEFNNQREEHVKQMQKELHELKAANETAAAAGSGNIIEEMHEQMNKVLDESRRSIAKANSERDQYKRDLDIAKREILKLSDQIHQLQERREGAGSRSSQTDSETMDALKAQIQICTEDFESERKDREKAQSKIVKLQAELDQCKRENDVLRRENQQRMMTPQGQTPYADPFYHYQLPVANGNMSSEGLAARGISTAGRTVHPRRNIDQYNVIDAAPSNIQADSDVTEQTLKQGAIDNDQTHVVDVNSRVFDENYSSLRASSISSGSKEYSSSSPKLSRRDSGNAGVERVSPKNTDILKCPKCDKEFGPEEHPDLLEHIDLCCD